MIATSGFLTALECSKFVFGRGSTPELAGGAYSAPQTPWFKGGIFLRRGERRKGKGYRRGKEGKERGGVG